VLRAAGEIQTTQENVRDWLQLDEGDPGFQCLTEEEIVCFTGTCLLSRCSETVLVYLPISRSLHSNGCTRSNIFRILKNPNVHYSVHKILLVVPLLIQINPVCTFTSYFTHLLLGLPSGLLLQVSLLMYCAYLSVLRTRHILQKHTALEKEKCMRFPFDKLAGGKQVAMAGNYYPCGRNRTR
jgi:hypothetical protein